MDDNYNFNDDSEVRPADNVVSEVLQEDTRSEYQKQIDEAIYLSTMEFCEQQKLQKHYEEKIIAEYYKVSNERKEQFREFLFDLNKLLRFDKETKKIYEIIEPIIDAYCNQYIKQCELDILTYDKIFKIIGSIKNNKNNIDILKKILIIHQ
jgi:hypothetical protein